MRWRTEENGGNWLRNHLWCPNDPCGQGIDDDDDDNDDDDDDDGGGGGGVSHIKFV